ncbi:helix-turn-helix domain-containing protein [Actinokineospora sp. NPDC004072]
MGEEGLVLLTAEQAAARLQLRPSWLRRKAAARVIPCRYVGKHLRFTPEDLTAIATQYAHTPAEPGLQLRRRVP